MVSASDSQSGGPGFESRSGHLLAGFVLGRPKLKSLATLVNTTGCLLPVWVFNPVMLYLNYFVSRYLSGVPVN